MHDKTLEGTAVPDTGEDLVDHVDVCEVADHMEAIQFIRAVQVAEVVAQEVVAQLEHPRRLEQVADEGLHLGHGGDFVQVEDQ